MNVPAENEESDGEHNRLGRGGRGELAPKETPPRKTATLRGAASDDRCIVLETPEVYVKVSGRAPCPQNRLVIHAGRTGASRSESPRPGPRPPHGDGREVYPSRV
jgi:hypothetical protein